MLAIVLQKGGLKYLKQEEPDIVCFQETKCTEKDCPDEVSCRIIYCWFSNISINQL